MRVEEGHHFPLDTVGNIFIKHEETAEVLNTFLALVINSRIDYHQDNWPPDLEDREGQKDGTPVMQKEEVKGLLTHLDADKSLGLDGIHAREIRQLGQELIKSVLRRGAERGR